MFGCGRKTQKRGGEGLNVKVLYKECTCKESSFSKGGLEQGLRLCGERRIEGGGGMTHNVLLNDRTFVTFRREEREGC